MHINTLEIVQNLLKISKSLASVSYNKNCKEKNTFLKKTNLVFGGELCLALRGCGVAKWLADLPSAKEFVGSS